MGALGRLDQQVWGTNEIHELKQLKGARDMILKVLAIPEEADAMIEQLKQEEQIEQEMDDRVH